MNSSVVFFFLLHDRQGMFPLSPQPARQPYKVLLFSAFYGRAQVVEAESLVQVTEAGIAIVRFLRGSNEII